MQEILTVVAANPAPNINRVVVQVLAILIYGVLAPLVYIMILYTGIELALPRGVLLRQRMREFWDKHEAVEQQAAFGVPLPSSWMRRPHQRLGRRTAPSSLEADPTFQIRCTVGGLIALAVLSLVITNWISGYPPQVDGPTFTHARYVFLFIAILGVGTLAGYAWASGMRRARGSRMSLAIVATSLSLSSVLLFYYLVEPGLRDSLVSLSLGIFVGELIVFAAHPTFLEEGLFGELVLLSPSDEGGATIFGPGTADNTALEGLGTGIGELGSAIPDGATMDSAGGGPHLNPPPVVVQVSEERLEQAPPSAVGGASPPPQIPASPGATHALGQDVAPPPTPSAPDE